MSDNQGVDLRALIAKATDERLTDGGRYFAESCDDLTRCRHEEIGEYQRSADGELIEWLWNRRTEIAGLYDARQALSATATPASDGEAGLPVAEDAVEQIAKVMHEADPDVGCTWEDWVAYAEAHPHFMPDIDFIRRAAKAVAASLSPTHDRFGEGYRAGVEASAKACEQQAREFLSSQYAVDQPLSSLSERFACSECAAAIRALQLNVEESARDLALTKAVRITAYNHADPLSIRFEFEGDADRAAAADEIDVILSDAFAAARAKMAAALDEARHKRGGLISARRRALEPDAGEGA